MTHNLEELLSSLPESNMTVRLLNFLDYLVPGEWNNITSLHLAVREATGETDEDVLGAVAGRAIELYMDESTGYQSAVGLYSMVDSASTFAGFTSMAAKLGEDVEWLGFLGSVTPKLETTQAIDAGLKLACELGAFCMTNGLPGDSIGDFMGAVASSAKEDKMRLAAWITCDCFLPLGPDFMQKIIETTERASESDFMQSGLFQRVASLLPGGGLDEKKQLVGENIRAAEGYVNGFVAERGLSHDGVISRVKEFLDVNEDRLDYASAILDMSTNVFLHTGTQSVARRCITRAYGEI
ncbi:MAG: hypothetical protein IPF92_02690 [Myxococcales bacterium]|jgi:hypothetical protein|nr:hypothetical protein [Myxococcales bacterium]